MKVEELIRRDGIVVNSQATYIVVAVYENVFRLDIEGKSEFRIKKGTGGVIALETEHPLLLEHGEPWSETYINSRPANPAQFIEAIRTAVTAVTGRWRDWKRYVTKGQLFGYSNFTENVSKGNGLLAYAPLSVTKSIVKACQAEGVSTFSTDGDYERPLHKVLLIGDNYVVANDFLLHPTSSAQHGLLR